MKRLFYLVLMLSAGAAQVEAFPNYAVLYKSTFTYLPACSACHEQESWEPNAFGKQFLKEGRSLKAFAAIKDLDADGDKASNIAEILAKSNPGDPHSKPGKAGDWLQAAQIKAPQKLLRKTFPDAEKFEVKEITLDDPKLPDESRFSVIFPAKSAAVIVGAGAYVSVELPGKDKMALVFVQGDRAGRLAGIKMIEYEGTKALKTESAWNNLLGKDSSAILKDGSIPGPKEEVDLFKATLVRGLRMTQAAFE